MDNIMKQFAERLDKTPTIGKGCYIAPSADVLGDVILGENVSIWHNTVIRGDINNIIIGDNSNVQDCSVLHVSRDNNLVIGKNVTVGHNVNLHGCIIYDNVLIGIGAIVLDECVIGENSIIAAGSLVPPGKIIPPNSMVMGSPAKIIRKLNEDDIKWIKGHAEHYIDYKDVYIEKKL